jgi:phosphate transport system substrate-binding protein
MRRGGGSGGRRAKWIVLAGVAIAAIVIALSAAAALQGRPPGNNIPPGNNTDGNGVTPPPPPPPSPAIVISAPSALPVMERWANHYNIEGPATVQVSYTDDVDDASIPIVYSNVSGLLSRHSADMAIMGRLPAQAGNFSYAGSVILPVSPQAVAIVYNVPAFPDVPTGLELDPATLHDILRGNITRWDDPAIKELNPGTDIPGEAIIVVHEGEAGSASDLLEQYLNSPVQWPETAVPADSADSLSTLVRQTPYSIGYVDYAYAVQTRMTYAALQNADGQFIVPSADSISRAIQNGTATQPLAANATATVAGMPPVMPVGQLGNGSYPIVGFYYAAHDGDPKAVQFTQWIVAPQGQDVLKDAQYPPLYEQPQATEAAMVNNNLTKTEEESGGE